MVRQVSLLAACALLTIGNARAQNFTGTYTLPNQTGVVTLTLKQDAQGKVTGSLYGNGSTFQIQGEVDGEDLVALASSSGGGGAYLEGHLEGNGIRVILAEMGPNNQPRHDQARELMFTRQGAGAVAGAAPTASPGAGNPLAATAPGGNPLARAAAPDPSASGMGPQDTRIAQLLLSSKWCHFSYSGVSGSSSGSSYTETVVFSPDGGMVVQTGGESYYSADVRSSTGNVIAQGSVAGQRGGGQQYRWRVQQGMLLISADGATWQPLALQISQNSNGYPIVTADGKEYSQCN